MPQERSPQRCTRRDPLLTARAAPRAQRQRRSQPHPWPSLKLLSCLKSSQSPEFQTGSLAGQDSIGRENPLPILPCKKNGQFSAPLCFATILINALFDTGMDIHVRFPAILAAGDTFAVSLWWLVPPGQWHVWQQICGTSRPWLSWRLESGQEQVQAPCPCSRRASCCPRLPLPDTHVEQQ